MDWDALKDFVVTAGLSLLQAGDSIFIKTLAQVYIWGRMLKKVETDPRRNLIALLSTIVFTAGYLYFT